MGRSQGILALVASSLLILVAARGPPCGQPVDTCQACLLSVRLLEDFLCDPEATDLLVDVFDKHVCPAVGDQVQCHNLAKGLLPTLVQWFRSSATPASLCSAAGVCGDALLSVPALNKPALRVRDTAECALCKYVVREVKVAVNNSQTLERIKEAALEVCTSLPDELATSCAEFVNTYEPLIAEMLETMDGDMVCGLLGVCTEAFAAVPPPPLPASMVKILAASKVLFRPPPPPPFFGLMGMPLPHGPGVMGPGGMMVVGGMMGHDGNSGTMDPHASGQDDVTTERPKDGEQPQDGGGMMPMMGGPMGPSNDACDYCKMAVIEAHSLVSNLEVQAEVVNYTKAVCDSFPSVAELCKTYVDSYSPLVFSLLEQYLVPDVLCVQTGMCPPPPAHPGFVGWLLDGWVGDLLRSLGLGKLLPGGPEPQPDLAVM